MSHEPSAGLDPNDHRSLGERMQLFHLSPDAAGAFWHPRGMRMLRALEDLWREEMLRHGFSEVQSPILNAGALWERSGHMDKYAESMFLLDDDGRQWGLKPMNCPGHIQIYRHRPRSWRELPLRLAERGVCHRREDSGALLGLLRLRQFTQDDAHLFVRPDQVVEEVVLCLELARRILAALRLPLEVDLSLRPSERLGEDADWDRAEQDLRAALAACGLEASAVEGEGAFYGPKLDLHVRDGRGRRWQLGSVQLDRQLPRRFDLSYRDAEDRPARPVMIHRAAFGSFERMLAILLEHHEGRLPLWLAPVPVAILPVGPGQLPAAEVLCGELAARGVASEIDARSQGLGKRIRAAHELAVPAIAVLGEREVAEGEVSLRRRGGQQRSVPQRQLVEELVLERHERRWEPSPERGACRA